MRSSLQSWVTTTQCQNSNRQSPFISKDKFSNRNTVACISCSKQINEIRSNDNQFICEEDFISMSKAGVMADGIRKFSMHQSQSSSKSRTRNCVLSYAAVILLLLMFFANVSPSSVSYDDLCLNVTWSGSTRCNCSMYSLNVSSCTNYSRLDVSISFHTIFDTELQCLFGICGGIFRLCHICSCIILLFGSSVELSFWCMSSFNHETTSERWDAVV